jgi:hypothetical protein
MLDGRAIPPNAPPGCAQGTCIMAAKVWADFDRSAPASDRVARAAHRQAITEIQELVRRA